MTSANIVLSLTTTVTCCARCGDDHKDVKFAKQYAPYYFPDDLKKKDPHWYAGMCPKTCETIRLAQYDVPDEDQQD